jgi:hypothetical protein
LSGIFYFSLSSGKLYEFLDEIMTAFHPALIDKIKHIAASTADTGVIIFFSNLLFELKLPMVLSPKRTVRIQTVTFTPPGQLRTERIPALSSTHKAPNINIPDDTKLAMRKPLGSLLYLPPHAMCPSGFPSANKIWKHVIPENPAMAIQAATC